MHLLLAKVSQASYIGVKPLKRLGFNRVVKFRSGRTGTKAYLAINDSKKLAVIVFRGTEKDGRDILTDISFYKEKYKGVKVHSGFLRAYNSVKGHINREIGQLPSDYELHATGHSLGGALACLYGLYGVSKPLSLVTYGQPRLGDNKLSQELSELKYTRVVYQSDLVPRIPKIGYRHGEDLLYYNTVGQWEYNPPWMSMFFDRLFSRVSHRLTDHKIQNYIDGLEQEYNI